MILPQHPYIQKVLKRFELTNVKPSKTPLPQEYQPTPAPKDYNASPQTRQ